MIISKTPFRISFFGGGTDYPVWFKEHGGVVLGTTIETTWNTPWSEAPSTDSRAEHLGIMKNLGFKTFLSLEPLAEFNEVTLKRWIRKIQPEAVEIGLENYTNFTDKPPEKRIVNLLNWLTTNGFTYVLKENLRHLEETANELD